MKLMRTSAGLLLLFLVNSPGLYAASSVAIPRVDKAPRLQDFEDMKPHGAATELRKISSFTQQSPSDGKPATQATDLFLDSAINCQARPPAFRMATPSFAAMVSSTMAANSS